MAFARLIAAAEDRDYTFIAEHSDLSAVQEGMQADAMQEAQSNPLLQGLSQGGDVAVEFVASLMQFMVESMMTPENIAQLLLEGEPKRKCHYLNRYVLVILATSSF